MPAAHIPPASVAKSHDLAQPQSTPPASHKNPTRHPFNAWEARVSVRYRWVWFDENVRGRRVEAKVGAWDQGQRDGKCGSRVLLHDTCW